MLPLTHSPQLMVPSSGPSVHTSIAFLSSHHYYFYVSFSLSDNELPKSKNCVSSLDSSISAFWILLYFTLNKTNVSEHKAFRTLETMTKQDAFYFFFSFIFISWRLITSQHCYLINYFHKWLLNLHKNVLIFQTLTKTQIVQILHLFSFPPIFYPSPAPLQINKQAFTWGSWQPYSSLGNLPCL